MRTPIVIITRSLFVLTILFVIYSGALDRDGFELLLMAMGHQLTVKELDACLADMGVTSASGPITFQLFLDWWTDSMGMDAMRKKGASRK